MNLQPLSVLHQRILAAGRNYLVQQPCFCFFIADLIARCCCQYNRNQQKDIIDFFHLTFYCNKDLFSFIACLNFWTVTSRESLLRPPDALYCPPPSKYFRAKVLQSKSPLLRKLHFLSSSLSITSPTSLIPVIVCGKFTSPSVSP